MPFLHKALVTAASIGLLVVPMVSFAEAPLTKTIIVPDETISDYVFPNVDVTDVKNFALVVENPFPTTAELVLPDQGKSYFVPWNSSRTVAIDISKQPVKFILKHGYYSGNVATGTIGESAELAAARALAGTSIAAADDNAKATLDDLIARNQYVAPAPAVAQQDESNLRYTSPVYAPAKKSSSYVRGYW